MRSVQSLYRIGLGPSSSHSLGPRRAAELFAARCPRGATVEVDLYGSLAATGRGHGTDRAIESGLPGRDVRINWHSRERPGHPNAMVFRSLDGQGHVLDTWEVYSVGGGRLRDAAGLVDEPTVSYPDDAIAPVLAWCRQRGVPFWEYVAAHDDEHIWPHLQRVWSTMIACVRRGLQSTETELPGGLQVQRRAASMLAQAHERVGMLRDLNLVSAYGLAVMEENASGHEVVTAPTCGACGVVPAVLYYMHKHLGITDEQIVRALATAGLFGSSAAERASISGAEVGCQGEVGVGCSMAAAAATQILGGDCRQVEYAAEMGLEHFLGLTCDPIMGLVQVPCIERNAFAAIRAIECAAYATSTSGAHLVQFDDVVEVMDRTGRDLQSDYRETARGGLARIMQDRLSKDPSLRSG